MFGEGGRDDLAEGWQNCMSGELLFWRQGSFNNLSLSSMVAEWTWNLILARKQIPFFYYRAPALTFSTLMTVLGINSSEFCSETLTAASFCILSVLMLFAQLVQSDIPVEHPKTCPAWRWGGQMCFLHMFLPTGWLVLRGRGLFSRKWIFWEDVPTLWTGLLISYCCYS